MSAADPGAVERAHRLAENAAMAAWGRPVVGPVFASDDLDRIGAMPPCGAMSDDDRAAAGLPTTDFGTLPGPAEGYPLRESRATLVRRRWLLKVALVAVVALLLAGFVRAWLP